ncbi:MAG: FAD-dependent oxidoreductase [Planctomycetaceae bacterium]
MEEALQSNQNTKNSDNGAETAERLVDVIIVGQGIAGTTLAWELHNRGRTLALIDRVEEVTASRAAAGLITPVTGKRMTQMPDFQRYWEYASAFYREVEQQTQCEIFQSTSMLRIFRNEEERQMFITRRREQLRGSVREEADPEKGLTGFSMQPAGRLLVKRYLIASKEFFSRKHFVVSESLQIENDVRVSNSTVTISRLKLRGHNIVFCQGYQPQSNPWFAHIPDKPARGDIVKVALPARTERRITHQGIWIVPEEGRNEFSIGATYDWKDLTNTPSEEGLSQLLSQLPAAEQKEARVVKHVAAVRPAMSNRKVVAGYHQEESRVAIFNGLGAKGCLVAPVKAKELAEEITRRLRNEDEVAEWRTEEFLEAVIADTRRKSLTKLVHQLLSGHLQPGDRVIDATAGNGYDTVLMAKRIGETGVVTAIDLQDQAIEATRQRVQAEKLGNVTYIRGCHAKLLSGWLRTESQSAITFNLGFLPGSDKTCVTSGHTTGKAIEAGYRLLKPGGVITVVAYRGHEGGQAEAVEVESVVSKLQREKETTVFRIEADTSNQASPVLLVIIKRKRQER